VIRWFHNKIKKKLREIMSFTPLENYKVNSKGLEEIVSVVIISNTPLINY